MNIHLGFQIDTPFVFVPWGITSNELQLLLGERLRCVADYYYTITCISLGGLACEMGFHFNRGTGELNDFEFFRRSCSDQMASYTEFQRYFEAMFGKPTRTESGDLDFEDHWWELGDIKIKHFVFNRFGVEEYMRITYDNYLNKHPDHDISETNINLHRYPGIC